MRKFLGVVLALLAGAAVAREVEHKRGEYRFSVAPEPAFVEAKPLPASWDAKAPGATGAAWRVWLFDEQIDRRAGRDQVYIDYAYETQSASLLGEAGRYQVTFRGLPVYSYAHEAPEQVLCNNVDGWFVVRLR